MTDDFCPCIQTIHNEEHVILYIWGTLGGLHVNIEGVRKGTVTKKLEDLRRDAAAVMGTASGASSTRSVDAIFSGEALDYR